MNISSIKYTTKGNHSGTRWRCKNGMGVFRNSLVLFGQSSDLQNVARAVIFAIGGRRYQGIEEVTIELTDNAGDTWEIWRGVNSSRFSHNGRIIPIDEAQRSMLAALLDMDPGIAHGNGLVSPVLYRILNFKNGVFTACDGLNGPSQTTNEPDPDTVIQVLLDECVTLTGRKEFANAEAVSKLSISLISLQARWSEVQASVSARSTTNEVTPSLGLIESLTRELDHLQHIDFFCKRMTDVHESVPRLTSQLETVDQELAAITSRWSKQALDAAVNGVEWNRGMECLVRVRAYTRLTETTTKLQRLSAKRLKPAAEKSMEHWHRFLFDSHVTGQEVESCLASMLLGMKQLSLDLEKLDQGTERPEAAAKRDQPRGWFDRLKTKPESGDVVNRPGAPDQHVDWLQKSVRDVEALKASIEYALKSVQSFSDEYETSKVETSKEFGLLDELSQKALDELTKLKEAWTGWAHAADIPAEISLEDFVALARQAHEIHILELRKADLQARLTERMDLQARLESQVRQWWNMIGSDKSVDISNPAFLVAEARAALRHRDTRRQRVQKMIKDAARFARDESLAQWNYKRRSEILAQWNDAFSNLDLPTLEMSDERVTGLMRLGSAVVAMKQLQAIRDQARTIKTDLWGPKEECPVRLYSLDHTFANGAVADPFVEMVKKFPSALDTSLTCFLVSDEEIAKRLAALGCGRAMRVDDEAAVPTQRVGAERARDNTSRSDVAQPPAETKAVVKDRHVDSSKITKGTKSRPASIKTETEMSQRAAAALRLLNPKSNRT